MTTFSSALKTNISRYGFKTAMVQTWKQVRAGKVERPPRRKKGTRKTREVNPTLRFKDLKENDAFQFVGAIKAELTKGSYIKYDSNSYYKAIRPKGAPLTLERVGSINVKVVKTGELVNPKRKKSKNPKKARRKNPIIIYNPHNSKLIYGKATIPEIRGTKTNGPLKGKHFKHKFNSEVSIYGLPNGAILIKPLRGQRLWANESDVDKYDKA